MRLLGFKLVPVRQNRIHWHWIFFRIVGDLTIEARRTLKATNLKRLLGTPEVRSRLGIEVRDGKLHVLATEQRVVRALMHVVDDIRSGLKVEEIYRRNQRLDYAANLPPNIAVKAKFKAGHGAPVSIGGKGASSSRARTATATIPRRRDKLIPSSCILQVSDARVQQIEIELRRLSLEQYPNAISVLLRVFLELSADSYSDSRNLGISQAASLMGKFRTTVKDLTKRKKLTPQQATPVYRACQKDSFLLPSVKVMHGYIHNQHVFPAPSDLRAHWDSLEPFVTAIWSP